MPVPLEKVPATQARQEALVAMPVPVEKVPALHRTQTVAPDRAW